MTNPLNSDLITACTFGDLSSAQKLVKQGADIQTDENLPILVSSLNGHLPVVQFLVEQGADLHTLNEKPLYNAAQMGHLSVVQYLVSQGAQIQDQYEDAPSIHMAACAPSKPRL